MKKLLFHLTFIFEFVPKHDKYCENFQFCLLHLSKIQNYLLENKQLNTYKTKPILYFTNSSMFTLFVKLLDRLITGTNFAPLYKVIFVWLGFLFPLKFLNHMFVCCTFLR